MVGSATMPRVAFTRRVTPASGGGGLAPLPELLERVAHVPGAFLRWAGAPGSDPRPWSVLAIADGPSLVERRWPRGRRLDERLAALAPSPLRHVGPRVPFTGGWVGALGYEARSGVERTPSPRPSPLGFPALWLGWADASLCHDPGRDACWVSGVGATLPAARRAAERLLLRLASAPRRASAASSRASLAVPALGPRRYRALVARVRRLVRAGDLFQANLSQRFDARVTASPAALFRRLLAEQPAPYATFLALPGGRAILSASPERFLRVEGARVRTEPMKGTRPRGATPAADRALARDLERSEKDRAELAMIVDLSRNDLARVCRPGSVRVVEDRRLLAFARVHQAIGVVEGRLARGRTRVDLLQAAFPPGSVTGAPKVRAMEVIDELEGEGRGPYCGALGWFDASGDLDLAVAIRTLLVAGRRASYRVGGGVTLRSDPAAEWRETLAKGRGLAAALGGTAR